MTCVGIIVAVQTFGDRSNFHPHLHLLVTEGAVVQARTKREAERIGRYMVRPVLALERLEFLEREGKVGCRHGDDGAELERTNWSSSPG